jgi:hypothetical protein
MIRSRRSRRFLMNSWVNTLYSLLVAVLLSSSGFAQSTPVITFDKMMTAEELKSTGVDTLTRAQRSALDRWLSEYTVKLIQLAQGSERAAPLPPSGTSPTAATYTGSGGGHWIKSKANNGGLIVLEDSSIWEINSLDRINTALWLPVTNVTVLRASQSVGDFKYLLVNKDDGEKALAKFLGKE